MTSAFDVIQLRALDQPESVEVARHALEHDSLGVTTDDDTLVRTYDLAQQFMPASRRRAACSA